MKFRPHILVPLLLLSCLFTTAQYGNIEFIENKGQWDSRVKFKGDAGAGAFFVRSTGFTIVQHNAEDWSRLAELLHGHSLKQQGEKRTVKEDKIIVRSHAYSVDFMNASASPQIVADKAISTYNNYFIGNDPSKWAVNCKIYLGITLKEVYPGIDVRYYTESGYLKYDIIAKPGADINKIALKYDGAEKLEVKNKELLVKTSVTTVKELSPYSYQFDGKVKKEISSRYVVNGNVVKFDIRNYDPAATLVIDPSIVFSSFSRSTADNWGFTATYGPDGSFYGGGIVMGTGFPTFNGVFQQLYGGGTPEGSASGHDIGIIKLTPDGSNRVYATYIGGSENEQANSLVVDGQGNLILTGRTGSSNYPLFPGNNIQGTGGGKDIVVTKLNAAGNGLIGSMRIGGSGNDGVNISTTRARNSLQQNYGDDGRSEVILDGAGNIYVASSSQSLNGFPFINGFQNALAGSQDAVVLKLNPSVTTLLFSTFLGGSGDDAGYVLSLGPGGNIYVAGGTTSTNFPNTAGSAVGPSFFGGLTDGFVAVISNNGTTNIRSAYIGTPGIDQVYGIQFDGNGFPYVMGQTTGDWQVINAAYSSGGKQFIAKLQPDLSAYVYSTKFGTGSTIPNISPVAFLVDRCENVYVSGWGGSLGTTHQLAGTNGLPVTPDAFKSTTDNNDLYFFVLKKNATSQLFGSFFGQNGGVSEHVDGGTSRFDRNGVIYQAICANCGGGAVYPIVGNVWGPNNPSNNCNLGMLKIEFNLAGVGSDVEASIGGVPRDTAGCVPLLVCFKDSIQNAVSYEWNFGDGSPQITTSRPDTCHTFNNVGTYRVMLVAVDSNTCNIRDTSYVTIRVGSLEVLPRFTINKLLPCDSFKYRFDNISFQPPSKPFTTTSFTWDFGDGAPRITTDGRSVFHQYIAPGTYNVKLIVNDTNYCNAPDSIVQQVRVAPFVEAIFDNPDQGCIPFTVNFTNNSLAGTIFRWDFGDGIGTSTNPNPSYTYTVPGTYVVTLIAIDSGTCNIADTTTSTIIVHGIPVADFSFAPDPPVVNTPTVFTNLSSPDAVSFKWDFGDGDTLRTNSRAPVSHQYNATGTFNACLIAFNAAGCPDTVCKAVRALVEPVLDVPNAFTPQSGGVNGVVMPRGFGIAKLRFIIYNRWGQKVFETTSRNTGWDGKYNGVLQPMDVYVYTLEVDFFDGTKASKKGDITLIR